MSSPAAGALSRRCDRLPKTPRLRRLHLHFLGQPREFLAVLLDQVVDEGVALLCTMASAYYSSFLATSSAWTRSSLAADVICPPPCESMMGTSSFSSRQSSSDSGSANLTASSSAGSGIGSCSSSPGTALPKWMVICSAAERGTPIFTRSATKHSSSAPAKKPN